jgi:hypothetical protein
MAEAVCLTISKLALVANLRLGEGAVPIFLSAAKLALVSRRRPPVMKPLQHAVAFRKAIAASAGPGNRLISLWIGVPCPAPGGGICNPVRPKGLSGHSGRGKGQHRRGRNPNTSRLFEIPLHHLPPSAPSGKGTSVYAAQLKQDLVKQDLALPGKAR